MANETVINQNHQSAVTQVNTASEVSAPNTIVNSALYNLSQIPIGTVLNGKYTVMQELSIMGGEASLFICEANGKKCPVSSDTLVRGFKPSCKWGPN